MRAVLLWEKRDLWVGVFWDMKPSHPDWDDDCWTLFVYVCLIPTIVLRVTWDLDS